MAALLPTILSDDDDEEETKSSSKVKKRKGSKKKSIDSSKKAKASSKEKTSVSDASDNDGNESSVDDDGEMDGDFEFGGLLGEDGSSLAFDALSTLHDGSHATNTWSYKSALALLSKNDTSGIGGEVERTSVASIIAAARSNLKRDKGKATTKTRKTSSGGGDGGGSDSSDSSDSSQKGDDKEGENSTESGDGTGSSDSDSDSDGESDQSDDEVDDADHARSMESDVLKVRKRQKCQADKQKKLDPESSSDKKGDESKSISDESDDSSKSEDDESEEGEPDADEAAEAAKASAFFESSHVTTQNNDTIDSFSQLGLSRPLLRGVASMGFVTPTPIQASVLPVALAGRDVCASAVTGSGKTAAFLLPVMERILQRGGGGSRGGMGGSNGKRKQNSLAATRVLVLTPTRELAAQCVSMMTAMAKFTDLRASLIVGGAKNVMSQAAELRTRPDVVVATPGRLLDHITNSQGVDVDDLEFLILDEADRLLDLGFQDEVLEIVKSCPTERQTMLFSATMNTKVDELIKLSLKRPVRIQATDKGKKGTGTPSGSIEVCDRLEQEFVRIRAGNEGVNREGMLLALLTRTFKTRVIVFFDTKSAAHRLMIVCGLCGIKCAELHGNLTQVQRLEALEAFREGSVDVLLATDLAARGLDITGVECVINFQMPSQVETYVHRIGRTARAGRGGKSCTLIGEGRRYLMKEVIKDAEEKSKIAAGGKLKGDTNALTSGVIRSRTIPPAVIAHFVAKINSLEQHIKEVIDAETVARMDRIAEMEATRAKNIIEHSDQIKSRPQKEWFASTKQRLSVKEAAAEKKRMIEEKAGAGKHRMTRKKRRAQEAREALLRSQEESREEAEGSGKVPKKTFSDATMKMSAKASRKKEAERQRELAKQSIHDEDIRKEQKVKKKRKALENSDALGDGGLFVEEKVSFAKKPRKESVDAPVKSSYFFKEFDPNKKRPKKKKSVNAFKSRSKYKRR